MREEIDAAVNFLTRLIGKSDRVTKEKLEEFQASLRECLMERFKSHWFPDKPTKGQAYRCIRVNEATPVDPVLQRASHNSGINYNDLRLPLELTLWVDPEEVTCRFGEHKGSYCIVATFKDGNQENYIDQINIDELEQRSIERSKNQSFEQVMNSRKKRQIYKNGFNKNSYLNGVSPNGVFGGLDYTTNGVINPVSSPNGTYFHNTYYGSPKYGTMYSNGSSPPQSHQSHPNQNFYGYHPMSPSPNRSVNGGASFRGPNTARFNGYNGHSPVALMKQIQSIRRHPLFLSEIA